MSDKMNLDNIAVVSFSRSSDSGYYDVAYWTGTTDDVSGVKIFIEDILLSDALVEDAMSDSEEKEWEHDEGFIEAIQAYISEATNTWDDVTNVMFEEQGCYYEATAYVGKDDVLEMLREVLEDDEEVIFDLEEWKEDNFIEEDEEIDFDELVIVDENDPETIMKCLEYLSCKEFYD